jgi:hypothetical protein
VSRARFLPSLLLICSGCTTLHGSRNAPGNIDVEAPPRNMRARRVERPRDPGEHVLHWNAGGLAGGGVATGAGSRSTASASAETSLHLGWSAHTHAYDEGLLPFQSPDLGHALGVNLGWSIGNSNRPASSAGYAELQYSWQLLASLAAGWAWDPARKQGGPQVTGTLGPVYLRSTTMLDNATSLEIGLVLKIPVLSYTWSR